VGTVLELWRYPVKSMVGERIGVADVTERGVPGDRTWACRDEVRGGIRGAKQLGPLMLLSARYVDGDPATAPLVTTPDGASFPVDAPDAAERVSRAIDHPVTLWPLQPADDLDHYRRGRPDHPDRRQQARITFGLDADDPLPDFGQMPPDLFRQILEFESPPGTYFDAYPLLLLSRQSLRSLARRSPGSLVDLRRFRPNLLVDLPEPGDAAPTKGPAATDGEEGQEFPELSWVGRRVQVGGAVIEVSEPCIRCVMISRPTADLPGDRDMQKVVVRQLRHTMGVYAKVVEPGRVEEGDTVGVLS
jgi:uncharacterized protein YcbX